MRICAVSLPELRVEIVRHGAAASGATTDLDPTALTPRSPLAVVVAPSPMTEAKLLGNTRLSVVSREARALGVQPGQTIAQARARASDLMVRVVRPDEVDDVLARIAEVGLAFGATVSFSTAREAEGGYGDIVWIDVTGCAHLHVQPERTADEGCGERGEGRVASSVFDGETVLATRLAGVIAELGYTCAIAIADGPRVAAMLARAAYQREARPRSLRQRGASSALFLEPVIVRAGENAAAIAPLPVAELPLPAEDIRWLAKIGIRTIEELRALPRPGLAARLGTRARDVLGLADGEDRAPLTPYVPPEVPEEEVELEYGIEGSQALTFVTKTLTDRLSARLRGRAVAAARVELVLGLDRGLVGHASSLGDADATSATSLVALELPAPLSEASDLLAAFRPKLERLALSAPVLKATLRAPVLVHKRAAVLSLFEPQPKAERALPRLVAELVSDLGADAVNTLVLGDSWRPQERSRFVPFAVDFAPGTKETRRSSEPSGKPTGLESRAPRPHARRMLSSVPEPTRLLAEPRFVGHRSSTEGAVRITRHLSRLEAVEWWKAPPSAMAAARRPVDYVQGWTDEGAAFLSIDRTTGSIHILGWFD